MNTITTILVCFIASCLAGIGTGFASLSAASVIGPLLATFLGVPTYLALGIGLTADIFSSAISAYTYKKNGNLDIKNAIVMMIAVLSFTFVGSYVASFLSNKAMSSTSVTGSLILGLKFLLFPVKNTKEKMNNEPAKTRILKSVLGGMGIGFLCGFLGAGGGMMMLLVFTTLLGYELKTAVGTSVFVMMFTAITGAISHFSIGGLPDIKILIMCVVFTFIFARIASRIANKMDTKMLNRLAGGILVGISLVVLSFNYLF